MGSEWRASGSATERLVTAGPLHLAPCPPDLVLRLPAYQLRADGPDVFCNFVVPTPPGGVRYVRGLQFRSGNRAVHHANIRVDATPASRSLDAGDPAPGYEGVIARTADFPDGHFLGWTPGQIAPALSDELSWRLDPGADVVVQLHLRPTGKPEEIAPVIGLYFGDRPPSRRPTALRLGRQDLEIQPGVPGQVVRDSFVVPVDVEVHAVQPHAHYRARALDAWATLPDGSRRALIRIADWDVNWQDRYSYAAPFWLPAGTRLTLEYVFDNTAANPRNPDRPPIRARWGWRSNDEMADLWLQVMTRSESDRARLAREPNHVHLRNDAAGIYLALGQPAKALTHFQAVTQLQRDAAPAWFNEGVALEAMGRRADARSRYRDALTRDAGYSPAHNNLGTLLLRDGMVPEARTPRPRRASRKRRGGSPSGCSLRRFLTTPPRLMLWQAPSRHSAVSMRPSDWPAPPKPRRLPMLPRCARRFACVWRSIARARRSPFRDDPSLPAPQALPAPLSQLEAELRCQLHHPRLERIRQVLPRIPERRRIHLRVVGAVVLVVGGVEDLGDAGNFIPPGSLMSFDTRRSMRCSGKPLRALRGTTSPIK